MWKALIVGILSSVMQAKFYFGIDAGYGARLVSEAQSEQTLVLYPSSVVMDVLEQGQRGYHFGVVFGSEDYYSRYFGSRYGLQAGYTDRWLDTGFSFDLLLDFFNNRNFGAGVFGGLGLDYRYGLDRIGHFMNLDGRLGVSFLILMTHRVELFARLPIGSIKMGAHPNLQARTVFGMGYKIFF